MTAPASYDDALFRQMLEKRKRDGMVSLSDIHEVFRVVAWDVFLAIEQQRNDLATDVVDEMVMDTIVPGLAKQLESEGWKINEYEER